MTSAADPAGRFRRSDKVDETRVGERVVLYHRDTGSGVVLNPTGSVIWDALTSPRSADDLAGELATRFPSTQPERIATDVNMYIESLLENGLISSDS